MEPGPWKQWLKNNWKYVVVFFTPLVLAIIPILVQRKEAYCGYVILVMASYWITEALPLAVTALVPVFAFPLMGILSSAEVTTAYMRPNIVLYMGGLMMAVAIEHCNLHKRIALFVLLRVGQSPNRLMTGFMLTTTFLSLWISNTAAAAMMVPIVSAILKELYPDKGESLAGKTTASPKKKETADGHIELDIQNGIQLNATPSDTGTQAVATKENASTESQSQHEESQMTTERELMTKALFLAVAYSANIGGTGVVTGSPTNLALMAQLADNPSELNFTTWMGFNVPGMIVCSVLSWLWLQFHFLGLCRKNTGIQPSTPEREAAVRRYLQEKYKELGRIKQQEINVLGLFILLVALWMFRQPAVFPGWTSIFSHDKEIADAVPVMLTVFLLFALPSEYQIPWSRRFREEVPKKGPMACMSWDVLAKKLPWNVVILLGGGSAMARGCTNSGLSLWLGLQFQGLQVLPKEAIVLIVCLISTMITEVVSNVATALVFLPVLKEMALNINISPLCLMLPATICCSFAFVLPVATPPNAIVFSAAKMKTSDMVKAGIVMNILCVAVEIFMINTLGMAMFDFSTT